MDMDIDTSRDRSATSIPYVKRIEAQSNNTSWAEQVKLNKMKEITLSYTTPKVGKKIC